MGASTEGGEAPGQQGATTEQVQRIVWLTSIAVGLPAMPDEFLVTCPFCGEQLEIYVEPDVSGSFVQDCEVCCNPWRVNVSGRGDDRVVHVTRADGSE